MRVITSKSKNAESFYISKGYINDKGVNTSVIIRKLGILNELIKDHVPTRDDVMAWAREEEYTCERILNTLKEMNFASIQGQGYIPTYKRSKLTDALH